uniref:Uncharacterized protein n=1 Tax=Arundo donax TaxID=35708 RepID=A0A0A8ZEN5_ARUDO
MLRGLRPQHLDTRISNCILSDRLDDG